ncbi:MAG TPA: aldo/keto reductase, partial [Micromonosporaceae bacterium]
EALAGLVSGGEVGLLGVSNQWAWRVQRARGIATAAGRSGYELLQYAYSYLQPRTDGANGLSPDGDLGVAGGDVLSYVRSDPGLTLVAYSPLLGGRYARDDRPLDPAFDHPGTTSRLAALREVARDADATANQVVLAWLMGGDVPVLPLVGASSVAQIAESLAAVDLELTADQRRRLDTA